MVNAATRASEPRWSYGLAVAAALAVALLAQLASPGPLPAKAMGQRVNYISSCTNITRPGYYELSSNISPNISSYSGNCIAVLADGVTLNGMGHAVSFGSVYIGASNVTVENLTVLDGDWTDFEVNGSHDVVKDVTTLDQVWGIYVNGNYNVVEDATANGSHLGIVVIGNDNELLHVTVSDDNTGVFIAGNNDTVAYARAVANWIGIGVQAGDGLTAYYDAIVNSTVLDNKQGVGLSGSVGSVVEGSYLLGNSVGLLLYSSSGDLIYNNLFDNTVNVQLFDNNSWAYWNVSPRPGINVVGGKVVGGNAWLFPNGTGPSLSCSPMAQDPYVCSEPYSLGGNNTDYLPLVYPKGVPLPNTTVTSVPSEPPQSDQSLVTTNVATESQSASSSPSQTVTVTITRTVTANSTATVIRTSVTTVGDAEAYGVPAALVLAVVAALAVVALLARRRRGAQG